MSLQHLGKHDKNGYLVQPDSSKDGRTKQAFKDECDISKIMSRAQRSGTISHIAKYEGVYGDFAGYDFHTEINKLTKGREIFDALPGEIRREFGQNLQAFFDYVNATDNVGDLLKKLPQLAAPGQQLIKTSPPTADQETALKGATEPVPPVAEKLPDPPAESQPKAEKVQST